MKPRPFAYVRPATVEGAVAALRVREDAIVLGGGQSLMPALALREREAGLLVDVSALAEMSGIAPAGDGVAIAAATAMSAIARDALVAERVPLLARVLATVGAPGIRSRATLAGSLAWADPTSQLPAALVALGARVRTTARAIDADRLFADAGGTVLARDELIVGVDVPAWAGGGLALVRRTHISWPVAGAVAVAGPDGVRVGLCGAGLRPVLGTGLDASAAAADALSYSAPVADDRAGAGYRARVLPVLARRALAEATGA